MTKPNMGITSTTSPARISFSDALFSGTKQRVLGILYVKAVGNQKHYQANPDSPIFTELCAIVKKTTGLADPLREALEPIASQISAAFVYGSVAKKTDTAGSDIDLMLLSDEVSYGELFSALENVSTLLGRTVNPTILTREEFKKNVWLTKSRS